MCDFKLCLLEERNSASSFCEEREELESSVQIEQLDKLLGKDGKWRSREQKKEEEELRYLIAMKPKSLL